MYSQNSEEKFIVDYFQNHIGKFLDIGAYNPFIFSNTRRLYELGWGGIFIEPSPICFKNFVAEYQNVDRITLINKAVVTDDRVEVAFYESNGDAVSTTNDNHKSKWENSGAKYNLIKVQAISIKEIEKFNDIDFLSLDVESSNIELFSAFSDEFLSSLKMICIEHDSMIDLIKSRLTGFNELHRNGENIILVK
jgi:FkbM family methyltransferase